MFLPCYSPWLSSLHANRHTHIHTHIDRPHGFTWENVSLSISDPVPQTNPELIKKGNPNGPQADTHTRSLSLSHTHTDWVSLTLMQWLGISGACSMMGVFPGWQRVTELKQPWFKHYQALCVSLGDIHKLCPVCTLWFVWICVSIKLSVTTRVQ